MYKKYTFPLHIFVVFEKLNSKMWSSNILKPNNYFVYVEKKWFYTLNIFFRNESILSSSYLTDIFAVDTLKFTKFNEILHNFFNKHRVILFYSYYFFHIKVKLHLVLLLNFFQKEGLNSIDKIYKNANWLEREVSEMSGVNYTLKKDIRKLLLDYSKNENPLLKDFPIEGFSEIFYNFFEDQTLFLDTSVVEL